MTYCLHCQTELPEGARYCFSCGKAVGQIEQGLKRIGRSELVPVIKEEPGSDREYVRIRDVVSVSDDAAALVVYCHASQQGQTVRVGPERFATRRVSMEWLQASVVARQVGGRTFYAAIFPRIYFATDKVEKSLHNAGGMPGKRVRWFKRHKAFCGSHTKYYVVSGYYN